MKEEIYTIPVMDGFKEEGECPFCAMRKKLNDDALTFVLSPSYMEEDVRGETNEKGFCQTHTKQLYERANSLGLALMLHSHMKHRMEVVKKTVGDPSNVKATKGIFSKKADAAVVAVKELRDKWKNSCYICDRIDVSYGRFMNTFFHLWKKQPDFQQTVKNGKGFCMDHYLELVEKAAENLKGNDLTEFLTLITTQQEENMQRVADDLEWFTLKFDYRYKDKPWKNSQDAIPRSILKINSQYVEKDKK